MSPPLLELARAGDQDAFDALVSPFRPELQVHCYRMLGSLQDAEDVLQESMLSAWLGVGSFEGRSSLRTWLYRITTNRCLNHVRAARRRPQVAEPRGVPDPTTLGEVPWLQPFPDTLLEALPDTAPGPEARYESREAITLAFVTALQHLPARQRATLILRDVLGYPAKDAAELLDISVVAANNALKRARASLQRDSAVPPGTPGPPAIPSEEETALIERFVDAFVVLDVDRMLDLMSEDVWLRMPPAPGEYHGRDAARAFFSALAERWTPPTRLAFTRANTHPAWGSYRPDPASHLWRLSSIEVAVLEEGLVSALTRFESDVGPWFGLPATVPAAPGPP